MKNIRLCAFADEADNALDGQIKALNRNGISLLEIRGVDGQNIKDVPHDKVKEIEKKLSANGISTWSIGSPVGKYDPNADFDSQLESFKHICESAHILGAKKIRMFSYFSKDTELVLKRLEALSNAAPDDIILCHENEKGIFGDNAECCAIIHKELPKIRAVFDPANFVQCDVDTKKAWEILAPYVEYMHIKDALASKHVVPAGYGIGNVEYLINEYVKQGGEVLTLEPHLMEFYGLKDLENGESMSQTPVFTDTNEAFDAGVKALKEILARIK